MIIIKLIMIIITETATHLSWKAQTRSNSTHSQRHQMVQIAVSRCLEF